MELKTLRKNREKYIAEMVKMSDKKLSKNLDIVRQQMEIAYRNRNEIGLENLYEMEDQIVHARRIKFDNEYNRQFTRAK